MLALQRTVGNRAVTAMIARDAKPAEAEPKDAAPKAGSRATIELGELGKLPLESWSSGGSRGGTGGTGAERQSKDITVTTKVGKHTAKLIDAAATGKRFDTAVIDAGYMVIRMTDVFVSAISTGGVGGEREEGASETWTLNYGQIEWKYKKGAEE